MKPRFARNAASLGVTFVVLIAFVAVGFAHTWQGPAERLDPQKQAYLSAGGMLGDICGPTDENGPASVARCDACVVQAGFALLDQTDVAPTSVVTRVLLTPPDAKSLRLSHAIDLSRASRAPPTA